MFRAAPGSSSGAPNCICSLWFVYTCGDRPLSRLGGKFPTQPWQQPVTTYVYKPEAANTVCSSWWWAVCRSKHVEPSINYGIINSITRLHPVGYFYWFNIHIVGLWIFTPCSLVGGYQSSEEMALLISQHYVPPKRRCPPIKLPCAITQLDYTECVCFWFVLPSTGSWIRTVGAIVQFWDVKPKGNEKLYSYSDNLQWGQTHEKILNL